MPQPVISISTCWMGLSWSLGLMHSAAPNWRASSNLDGLVSMAMLTRLLLGFSSSQDPLGGEPGVQTVLSEINVTPFVDVMLVLLVIFMVTAPMLNQGVKVDLPKVSSEVLTMSSSLGSGSSLTSLIVLSSEMSYSKMTLR